MRLENVSILCIKLAPFFIKYRKKHNSQKRKTHGKVLFNVSVMENALNIYTMNYISLKQELNLKKISCALTPSRLPANV